MKRLSTILLACTALSVSTVKAQNTVIVGENYLTGDTIRAQEFAFPKRIYDLQLVDSTSRVIIQLREINQRNTRWEEDGKLICFDLKEHKHIWSQRISYFRPVVQSGNLLLFCDYQWEQRCCDIKTGELKCSPEERLFYLSPSDSIGIGYNPGNLKKVKGIDLNTGDLLWEKKIKMEYGVNDIRRLNDSTVLLSCSGLHALNLRDGTGWDFDAKTGLKDFTAAAAGSAVGIALGMVTGIYTVFSGYDVLADLCSNVLIDGDRIYFADTDRLSCLGTDGCVRWQQEFAETPLSKSFLFTRGRDTLVLLNLGYGHINKVTESHGRPFIAAYDRNTGARLYAVGIGGENYPVNKFLVEENSITLLLEDKIAKCPLAEGEEIFQRRFSDLDVGYLNEFIREDACMQYGDTFIPLKEAYPDGIAVQGPCRVFIMGSDLEIIDSVEDERIFWPVLTVGEHKFMSSRTELSVADCKRREVARIEASGPCFRNGDLLYLVKGNSIREIDLSVFLPEED